MLAARLSEDPHVSVLMLEAGDKDTDRPETPFITTPGLANQLRNSSIDWKFITAPQHNALRGYNNRVSNYCIYLRNKSWKPECVLSFNMGWRILVNCIPRQDPPTHVKLKTHSDFHELFRF